MLQGLSAEESEWLERKAERLGDLAGALRYLLREGLMSFLFVIAQEKGDKVAWNSYIAHLAPLRRRGRARESPTPARGRR